MAVKFGKDGTLYCNTVRYNYKQARNLVADGTNAVLGGTGAWNEELTNVNVSTMTGTFRFGTGFAMMRQSMPAPIAGHKYYGALLWSLTAGATTGDNRFEWFSGDGDNEKMVFANKTAVGGMYVLLSSIQSLSTVITGSAGSWSIRNFCTDLSAQGTCKNIMVIDLTDTFGAGNEPTKEWCDQNIIEHNLLNNVGDHLCATPTQSTYNFGAGDYTQDAFSSAGAWGYCTLDDVTQPRDYTWFIQGSTSKGEGFIYSTKNYYTSPSYIEYFQIMAQVDSNNLVSNSEFQLYHPVQEPSLGRAKLVDGTQFNGGGSMTNWKKYSIMNTRTEFSVGNYPIRFDLNNRNLATWAYMTGFFLTTVNSQVTWYNYNINNGSDIAVSAVNREWCERWVGGPLNSIIHIKDHQNTLIKIGGRGDYVELDYLESTGTQFINPVIGFKNGSSFAYELRCQFPTSTTSTGSGHHRATIANTNGLLKVGYAQTNFKATEWNTAKVEWSSGNINNTLRQSSYVNGELVAVNTTEPYDTNPYLLFACCSWTGGNNGIPPYSYEKMRISACKIYQDSEIVRDLVPCIRLSDRAIGMYDKVTQSFFGNAGTGTFIFNRVRSTTFNSGANPTDYDIICNDIEIRPEQNKIIFNKTGTIICKKLVKTQNF